VLASVVRLLRIASIVICLIVGVSFLVFVVDQTKSASGHQQEQLTNGPAGASTSAASAPSAPVNHENSVHRTIDDAANTLTSPFAGAVSGSSSEWVIRGVKLLLALAVYGFGLGYVARALRVRV
jgi:hypothetical protein